jgi:hypothetical protein
MSAEPQAQSKPTSRRALLAGVLGGLGTLFASAIGRASPVRAGVDGDVVLGAANTASTPTQISNSTTSSLVFGAQSVSGTGIIGQSTSLYGVLGSSQEYVGVQGTSTHSIGVRGDTNATDQSAVFGHAVGDSTGVFGASGSGALPNAKDKTGVYGYAAQDAASVGVQGESVDGIGLLGLATGSGVAAFGLFARSNSPDAAAIGARSSGNGAAILAKSGTGSFPAPKAKTAVYGYAAQDSSARGLWGETTSGHAIHGTATSGFAGYFAGKVYTTSFHEMTEIASPAAPAANKARLFLRDSGSKTQLCVRFSSGAIQVLATQP